MQNIGIIAKRGNAGRYINLFNSLIRFLEENGKTVILDDGLNRFLADQNFHSRDSVVKQSELLIVFGGDGTILKTVQLMKKYIPILGVNIGGLGILTQAKPQTVLDGIKKILEGKFTLDKRALLEIKVNNKTVGFALNEAEINQGPYTRIIQFVLNGEKINSDGLIISTPTGSTGHSFSAGGEILHPHEPNFIITPIAPLNRETKPCKLKDDSDITINFKRYHNKTKNLGMNIDGQIHVPLTHKDTILIRKALKKAIFVIPSPS